VIALPAPQIKHSGLPGFGGFVGSCAIALCSNKNAAVSLNMVCRIGVLFRFCEQVSSDGGELQSSPKNVSESVDVTSKQILQ
jgi:hypothetical protein